MESEAYKAIKSVAAAKALPVFLCKFSAASARGEKPICEFTYTEAKLVHGIARKSFARGVKEIHNLGFIDVVKKGGMREGSAWSATKFRKSDRWRDYGTHRFIEKEWNTSEPQEER